MSDESICSVVNSPHNSFPTAADLLFQVALYMMDPLHPLNPSQLVTSDLQTLHLHLVASNTLKTGFG